MKSKNTPQLKKPLNINEFIDFRIQVAIDIIEEDALSNYGIKLDLQSKLNPDRPESGLALLKAYLEYLKKLITSSKEEHLVEGPLILNHGTYLGEILITIIGGEWVIQKDKGSFFYGWPTILNWADPADLIMNPYSAMKIVFRNMSLASLKSISFLAKESVKLKDENNDSYLKELEDLLTIK